MAERREREPMTSDQAIALLDACELHRVLGLELREWAVGRVVFGFEPPPMTRDVTSGGVHGGAIATALDTVAGFAVISSSGHDIFTVDLRVDFVRPALDREFTVEGQTLRAGKRFGWADATVYAADGRVVAVGRGTFGW